MSETSPPVSLSGADARRAARNVSALMLASVVSKGALYLWQIALSVMLGPAEYGIYGTVGALMVTSASVASFGTGLIVIRDVARQPRKAGAYWTSMLFIQTTLAIFAYIGMNLFAGGYSETLRAFAALAGINIFIDLFGNMGYDLLLSRERMVATSVVEVAHIFLRIGMALLAIALGWGLLGVYGAAVVSGSLRSLALTGLNLRAGLRPEFPLDRAIALPLLRNSAPLALSAFLSLAYQHSDKLLTTGILGETVTGYLTAAFVINFGVIELLSVSILAALYPLLSRNYDDGRNPAFGFMVEKLALFSLIVCLPLALSVSILADKLMTPLLGEIYAPSAGILRLLIWYTAITIFGNVFSQAMLAQNRQTRLLAIRSSGLALNVVMTALLLFAWRDPRGAALASVVGELLVVGLMLLTFRALGCRLSRVARSGARLAAIALPTALIMLALREQFVALPLVCGAGFYLIAIAFGRVLGEEDWDLAYRLAATFPGGGILRRVWKREVQGEW